MLCLQGAHVIDDAAAAATVVGNMPWKSCAMARPPRAPGVGQLLMKGDFFFFFKELPPTGKMLAKVFLLRCCLMRVTIPSNTTHTFCS